MDTPNPLERESTNQLRFKETLEGAVVEIAFYKWINGVLDALRRKVDSGEIEPDRARQIWKIKRGCYDCCKRALQEGRFP
jgi:hypothetical protein